MTLILTACGALVASASHLSVSRHAPPPGWGYAWAVYEAGLPLLLVTAQWLPAHAPALHSVAAGLAVVGGCAGLLMARLAGPALRRDLADAHFGRAVSHAVQRGKRDRTPSPVAQELARWRKAAQATIDRETDRSDPPEA